MAIRPALRHLGSEGIAAPAALVFLLGLGLMASQLPLWAGELVHIERFNCGRLGLVVLRSASRPSLQAGHTVFQAQVELQRRGIRHNGLLHSMMGGKHRVFTRATNDDPRSPHGSSAGNPVILRVVGDGVVYGKQRQEISIVLLREAYTCIPS